jgi:hypothetical protein
MCRGTIIPELSGIVSGMTVGPVDSGACPRNGDDASHARWPEVGDGCLPTARDASSLHWPSVFGLRSSIRLHTLVLARRRGAQLLAIRFELERPLRAGNPSLSPVRNTLEAMKVRQQVVGVFLRKDVLEGWHLSLTVLENSPDLGVSLSRVGLAQHAI